MKQDTSGGATTLDVKLFDLFNFIGTQELQIER